MGMLGSAFREELARLGAPFEATDREVDIAELDALRAFAKNRGFSHVLNCAGYTRVDDAEADEEEAFRINSLGAGNVACVAAENGATVLHFSTDYVFDGYSREAYRETDPCAPLSAYGRSKLDGERRFLINSRANSQPGPHAYVVRTSWLFGMGGKNFVTTILGLLANQDSLRVVEDQVGRPTYCPDLCDATLRLLGLAGPPRPRPRSGVYHFANAGSTSWHGFASEIFALAKSRGFPVRASGIEAIKTKDFPRPALRPAQSVLNTERAEAALQARPRPWQIALAEYIDRLKQ